MAISRLLIEHNIFNKSDHFIDFHLAETLSELREKLKSAIDKLTNIEYSVASVASGCELFLRFITLTSLDHPVSQLKHVLENDG